MRRMVPLDASDTNTMPPAPTVTPVGERKTAQVAPTHPRANPSRGSPGPMPANVVTLAVAVFRRRIRPSPESAINNCEVESQASATGVFSDGTTVVTLCAASFAIRRIQWL